jgi:hypothetical protein
LHAAIESSPDEAVIDKAEQLAATAEVAYRESRDRLTDEMIAESGEDSCTREQHE